MNPAFRQIGNSVPPLLSFAIARHLYDTLGCNQGALDGLSVEPQLGSHRKPHGEARVRNADGIR